MQKFNRRNLFGKICAGAILAAAMAGTANAGTGDFFGRWTNIDHDTSGIAYVIVKPDPSGAYMRVFGACHPTDCDWGAVEVHLYAGSVSQTPLTTRTPSSVTSIPALRTRRSSCAKHMATS